MKSLRERLGQEQREDGSVSCVALFSNHRVVNVRKDITVCTAWRFLFLFFCFPSEAG
jgi:hypothetical protein